MVLPPEVTFTLGCFAEISILLVLESIVIPAGAISIFSLPGVLMVTVGGRSARVTSMPAGVTILRISASGDDSGGGFLAFHKHPMT